MGFYDQRTLWAVKTVEEGPHVFYALMESLDAALASLSKYQIPIPARGPRTFYVVYDMRDLEKEIREAYGYDAD